MPLCTVTAFADMRKLKLAIALFLTILIWLVGRQFSLKEISDLPLIHPIVWNRLWKQDDLVNEQCLQLKPSLIIVIITSDIGWIS